MDVYFDYFAATFQIISFLTRFMETSTLGRFSAIFLVQLNIERKKFSRFTLVNRELKFLLSNFVNEIFGGQY